MPHLSGRLTQAQVWELMTTKQVYASVGLALVLLFTGGMIALVLTSCRGGDLSSVAPPTSTAPGQDGRVNLVLHVLNSSNKLGSIGIKVYIDGKLEIDDNFESTGSTLISIPPHKTFQFHLGQGTHTIRAVSVAGDAVLEEQFEIADKRWALIGYEYWSGTGTETPPKHFEFVIQDDPIRFQ